METAKIALGFVAKLALMFTIAWYVVTYHLDTLAAVARKLGV